MSLKTVLKRITPAYTLYLSLKNSINVYRGGLPENATLRVLTLRTENGFQRMEMSCRK